MLPEQEHEPNKFPLQIPHSLDTQRGRPTIIDQLRHFDTRNGLISPRKILSNFLLSDDRILLIAGPTGSGKTFLAHEAEHVLKEENARLDPSQQRTFHRVHYDDEKRELADMLGVPSSEFTPYHITTLNTRISDKVRRILFSNANAKVILELPLIANGYRDRGIGAMQLLSPYYAKQTTGMWLFPSEGIHGKAISIRLAARPSGEFLFGEALRNNGIIVEGNDENDRLRRTREIRDEARISGEAEKVEKIFDDWVFHMMDQIEIFLENLPIPQRAQHINWITNAVAMLQENDFPEDQVELLARLMFYVSYRLPAAISLPRNKIYSFVNLNSNELEVT